MKIHAVDCDLDADCYCHPIESADICDWCAGPMNLSAGPSCVNPIHHASPEWLQCLGCGEMYDPFEESHVGHRGGVA